ncbi:GNAT family N-acetyltransferase [Acinetobacter sp. ANC 5054]|uniref:GNAT family N-acetyltransferase n=1 Tax=Acinetobacter sp. ANC 5054 TaxID=1977877 RepID=UPI000A32D763|nr:GNAT family N-acetyltransferase [Acinetobacter sp. ANC 5054]OTG76479.1 GNAT family N-acetyltransferase [Acinetobacter sp. ANC 5054]
MLVQQQDDQKKGAFFIEQEGDRLAEMTYSWAGDDKFIIDHTDVSDSLRGQGVGRHLLDAAVNFAREKHVKIIPLCPYAKSVFDKDPIIHDVLR